MDALCRTRHGTELVVEAMAVEGILPVQVTVAKVDDGGIGVSHELKASAGVGGPYRVLASAGKDQSFDGAQGGAPSLLRCVAHVAGNETLEGGIVHGPGVIEDTGGISLGGSHSAAIIPSRSVGHRVR